MSAHQSKGKQSQAKLGHVAQPSASKKSIELLSQGKNSQGKHSQVSKG